MNPQDPKNSGKKTSYEGGRNWSLETSEVEKDGVMYTAKHLVDENIVTVFGDIGQESTQVDGMSEERVARMLLNNLMRKGHIKFKLDLAW